MDDQSPDPGRARAGSAMPDESEWRRKVRTAPLAPLGLAASAGVVLDRFVDPWGSLTWGLLAMLGAWVAAIAWRWPRLSAWSLALAIGAIGGGWHHARWSDLAADDPARADWPSGLRRPSWVRGVIVEGPTFRAGDQGPGDRGSTRLVLALTGISDGRDWHPASGLIQTWVAGDRSDLEAGRPVEAAGDLSAIEGPLNPGETDSRPILRAKGIRLRLAVGDPSGVWPDPSGREWPWSRWLGAVRAWSARKLASGLDPEAVPLASALLLGRREAVDPEVNDAFARTGTTHLLAISGLHLQVLALAIGGLARALGLGRKGSYLVVMAGTVAYALLVGLMPSVVRSAAMTCGACAAGWRDRCVGPANLLAGAALATLIMNPSDLFDVGCQLSFAAVAAILWLVPSVLAWDVPVLSPLDVLERQLEPWWRFLGRVGLVGIRDGLRASAIIWMIGWPLVALRFHLVSPIGILINIPLIPLTSIALLMAGLTLALSAIWSPLGLPFAWATGRALGWTEAIVRWATSWRWGHAFVPGPPSAWVLAFYALVGLAMVAGASRWRSGRRWWGLAIGCGAVGAILPMIPARPDGPEAEVLAVGHGLSVAIRSAGGETVLYDCGKMSDPHVGRSVIAPALWSRGARRIDSMILTHADSDHYNGLPDLLDRFEIGEVRVPPGFESPANPGAKTLLDAVRARGIPVVEIARGDRIDLDEGPTLEVLQPRREASPGSTDNARSVVLDVASGGHRLLLTGDLEGEGLTDLVQVPAPRPPGAMLAPHHGGRSSNPAWLYEWADPALVVASQRAPTNGSRDPLAPLAEGHFAILRTWEAGAIRLGWTPSGLSATGFLDRGRAEVRPIVVASIVPGWSKALATVGGLALGAVLCLVVTVAEWGAWSLVMPGRKLPAREPTDPPGQPIEATTPDGVRLAGTWFPAGGHRVILLLHGLAEDRVALLARVPSLNRRGWSVATLDARATGESGGHRGSMGTREADDVHAWLDALTPLAGPDPAFAAWGRSMGAAAALKAAATAPRLAALILEAPYLDLAPTVAAVLRRLRIPGFLARLVLLRARMLAGVPLDRPRPIDLAPKVQAPTLILHGLEDPIAPIAGARTLALAIPQPAEVVEVPEAGHANVVGVGGDPLMDRVGDFLDRAIPPRGG